MSASTIIGLGSQTLKALWELDKLTAERTRSGHIKSKGGVTPAPAATKRPAFMEPLASTANATRRSASRALTVVPNSRSRNRTLGPLDASRLSAASAMDTTATGEEDGATQALHTPSKRLPTGDADMLSASSRSTRPPAALNSDDGSTTVHHRRYLEQQARNVQLLEQQRAAAAQQQLIEAELQEAQLESAAQKRHAQLLAQLDATAADIDAERQAIDNKFHNLEDRGVGETVQLAIPDINESNRSLMCIPGTQCALREAVSSIVTGPTSTPAITLAPGAHVTALESLPFASTGAVRALVCDDVDDKVTLHRIPIERLAVSLAERDVYCPFVVDCDGRLSELVTATTTVEACVAAAIVTYTSTWIVSRDSEEIALAVPRTEGLHLLSYEVECDGTLIKTNAVSVDKAATIRDKCATLRQSRTVTAVPPVANRSFLGAVATNSTASESDASSFTVTAANPGIWADRLQFDGQFTSAPRKSASVDQRNATFTLLPLKRCAKGTKASVSVTMFTVPTVVPAAPTQRLPHSAIRLAVPHSVPPAQLAVPATNDSSVTQPDKRGAAPSPPQKVRGASSKSVLGAAAGSTFLCRYAAANFIMCGAALPQGALFETFPQATPNAIASVTGYVHARPPDDGVGVYAPAAAVHLRLPMSDDLSVWAGTESCSSLPKVDTFVFTIAPSHMLASHGGFARRIVVFVNLGSMISSIKGRSKIVRQQLSALLAGLTTLVQLLDARDTFDVVIRSHRASFYSNTWGRPCDDAMRKEIVGFCTYVFAVAANNYGGGGDHSQPDDHKQMQSRLKEIAPLAKMMSRHASNSSASALHVADVEFVPEDSDDTDASVEYLDHVANTLGQVDSTSKGSGTGSVYEGIWVSFDALQPDAEIANFCTTLHKEIRVRWHHFTFDEGCVYPTDNDFVNALSATSHGRSANGSHVTFLSWIALLRRPLIVDIDLSFSQVASCEMFGGTPDLCMDTPLVISGRFKAVASGGEAVEQVLVSGKLANGRTWRRKHPCPRTGLPLTRLTMWARLASQRAVRSLRNLLAESDPKVAERRRSSVGLRNATSDQFQLWGDLEAESCQFGIGLPLPDGRGTVTVAYQCGRLGAEGGIAGGGGIRRVFPPTMNALAPLALPPGGGQWTDAMEGRVLREAAECGMLCRIDPMWMSGATIVGGPLPSRDAVPAIGAQPESDHLVEYGRDNSQQLDPRMQPWFASLNRWLSGMFRSWYEKVGKLVEHEAVERFDIKKQHFSDRLQNEAHFHSVRLLLAMKTVSWARGIAAIGEHHRRDTRAIVKKEHLEWQSFLDETLATRASMQRGHRFSAERRHRVAILEEFARNRILSDESRISDVVRKSLDRLFVAGRDYITSTLAVMHDFEDDVVESGLLSVTLAIWTSQSSVADRFGLLGLSDRVRSLLVIHGNTEVELVTSLCAILVNLAAVQTNQGAIASTNVTGDLLHVLAVHSCSEPVQTIGLQCLSVIVKLARHACSLVVSSPAGLTRIGATLTRFLHSPSVMRQALALIDAVATDPMSHEYIAMVLLPLLTASVLNAHPRDENQRLRYLRLIRTIASSRSMRLYLTSDGGCIVVIAATILNEPWSDASQYGALIAAQQLCGNVGDFPATVLSHALSPSLERYIRTFNAARTSARSVRLAHRLLTRLSLTPLPPHNDASRAVLNASADVLRPFYRAWSSLAFLKPLPLRSFEDRAEEDEESDDESDESNSPAALLPAWYGTCVNAFYDAGGLRLPVVVRLFRVSECVPLRMTPLPSTAPSPTRSMSTGAYPPHAIAYIGPNGDAVPASLSPHPVASAPAANVVVGSATTEGSVNQDSGWDAYETILALHIQDVMRNIFVSSTRQLRCLGYSSSADFHAIIFEAPEQSLRRFLQRRAFIGLPITVGDWVRYALVLVECLMHFQSCNTSHGFLVLDNMFCAATPELEADDANLQSSYRSRSNDAVAQTVPMLRIGPSLPATRDIVAMLPPGCGLVDEVALNRIVSNASNPLFDLRCVRRSLLEIAMYGHGGPLNDDGVRFACAKLPTSLADLVFGAAGLVSAVNSRPATQVNAVRGQGGAGSLAIAAPGADPYLMQVEEVKASARGIYDGVTTWARQHAELCNMLLSTETFM